MFFFRSLNEKLASRSVILGTTNASDVSRRISVEETVAHTDYQSYEDNMAFKGENDIALIRLSEDVKFTKYIQPICLPFTTPDYYPPSNETNFTMAGWGNRRFTSNNDILEFVEAPFFSFNECEQIYEYYGRELTDHSICAGGVPGESFCIQDGGGPLMREIEGKWVLDGIITKTTEKGCASKTPGIFVNVLRYERWIKEYVMYGWDSNEIQVQEVENEAFNAVERIVKLIMDWRFWVLVLTLVLIIILLISCCMMISKFWKTHKACIMASCLIVFIAIVIFVLILYFCQRFY